MIAGFERRATLYESATLEITRSVRTADGVAVVIKAIKRSADSPQLRSRLKREHELLQGLARDGVRGILKPLSFAEKADLCCLISADSGGTSLQQLLEDGAFGLREALDVGVQLCNIVMDLHACQVIHKRISPHNVVLNRRTAQVELIDFGGATQMARELQPLDNLQSVQNVLAYVSPEQTGRLNRWLDYRTDLYSLGATLYALVTGHPPFEGSDFTQLVYSVLAKMPPPAHSQAPQLPAVVSAIIAKLMEKMPEQRYQSAQGVRADLAKCQEQLTSTDRIESFTLGRQDHTHSLEIPQRLYGRTAELATLRKLLVRIPTGGAEFIMVHGVSGAGKTALLHEALRDLPVDVQCASAKHDPTTRHVPFSAIGLAVGGLLGALLKKPEAERGAMRRAIAQALGRAGQALLPMLPNLEQWVSDLPPLPELTPLETENRLLLLWHRLLTALAEERPLVLLLDDLQWADAATLKVLKFIAIDERPKTGIRVIGSYRDNEIDSAHPLTRLLEQIRHSPTPLHSLPVGALLMTQVQELLVDATRASSEQCLPLAELIYDKTAGNPFFVREYVRHLWRNNLIAPDDEQNLWTWDLRAIAMADIPDNAVGLMMSRLASLPMDEHALLSWAACLGSMFRLTDLCAAVGLTREHTLHLLRGPEEANLVLATTQPPDDLVYKFSHDRIQQAAYEMLSPREAVAAHYTMGRVLQMRLEEGETAGSSVFAVVGHLNSARDMILDPRERMELAQLNLTAAREARNGAAHGNALSYLHQALQALPPDAWVSHYALRRDINLEQIVSEFMLSNLEAAHARIQEGMQHAQGAIDRAELLRQQVICSSDTVNYGEALETGIKALRELGVDMPLHPSRLQVRWSFLRTHLALSGRDIATLRDMPELTDERALRILRMLGTMYFPAFFSNTPLCVMLMLANVRLTLKHGTSVFTAMGFGGMVVVYATLSRLQDSLRCAEAVRAALHKHPGSMSPEICRYSCNAFAEFVQTHPHEQQQLGDRLLNGLLERGDPQYAGICLHGSLRQLSLTSIDLCLQKVAKYQTFLQVRGTPQLRSWVRSTETLCRALAGQPGPTGDAGKHEEDIRTGASGASGQVHYFSSTVAHLVRGEVDSARKAALAAVDHGIFTRGSFQTAVHYSFVAAVAMLRHAAALRLTSPVDTQVFHQAHKRLRLAAACGSLLYGGLPLLIDAGLEALRGKGQRATRLYEQALGRLDHCGVTAFIALGSELAARHQLAQGLQGPGCINLQRARDAYGSWGARPKAQEIDQELRRLAAAAPADPLLPPLLSPPSLPGSVGHENVNVPALMQVAQTLLEIDDAKSQFMANISHEFRTPLTLIIGPLETMQQDAEMPARFHGQLGLCRRSGLRLLRLVDDLLELSRLEASQVPLRMQPVMLSAAVLDLVHQVQTIAQRKNITVVSDLRAAPEVTAMGDVSQIERVILNLLSNALKFTPHGGKVAVRLDATDAWATISVEDTGVGIPAEALSKIFERFYQVDTSDTRPAGGAGIGLALSRKIVELHGGRIGASSTLGRGTTVHFTLPRGTLVAESQASQPETPPEWQVALRQSPEYRLSVVRDSVREAAPNIPRRPNAPLVLAADDSEEMLDFLQLVLGDDYDVLAAQDGASALRLAQTERPDLVISDVMMPELNGFALAHALRRDEALRQIPIILLTARDTPSDRVTGLDLGADAYITKPFHAAELRSTVQRLLRQQGDQQLASRALRTTEMQLLIASISHEILNPLGFIRNAAFVLAEAARHPTGDAEVTQDAQRAVEDGIKRVLETIEKLRAYGASGPNSPVMPTPIDEVVANVQRLAGYKVQFTSELRGHAQVNARAGQLEQVLLNLLLNSQDDSLSAGGLAPPHVQCWQDGTTVCLSVSDRRPQGAPQGAAQSAEGGLGLSLSRQILRELGGELRILTESDATTFTVRLPTVPC